MSGAQCAGAERAERPVEVVSREIKLKHCPEERGGGENNIIIP